MSSANPKGRMVLFAASMVSMVLGSLHAFSVFLGPLETKFGYSRATVSLTYSFSLMFLTAAVLFGPAVYARLRPPQLYTSVALLGAAGTVLASLANGIAVVWLGFSFMFGIANGLGYGFGLQFSARANPEQPGLAMGIVTASYALGAVLAPYGFKNALEIGGWSLAMLGLAILVFTVSVSAAILTARSGVSYSNTRSKPTTSQLPLASIATIWIAYGCSVAAGLMAIGHAAGIAATANFSDWIAAVAIASGNLFGSLLCGGLSDRISHRSLLTVLPLLGAATLLLLSFHPDQSLVLLGVVGFSYGGTIATYPAVIANLFPGDDGPRAYGRVFTAWGTAGLLAPWVAGQIYDWNQSYAPALWAAAGLGIASAFAVQGIYSRKRP